MNDSNFTDALQWTTEELSEVEEYSLFCPRSRINARIEQLARQAEQVVVRADLVEQARLEFGQ